MKKTVLWIILDSIFLIIFNALFFVLGGTGHTMSVWISYGFIHFAYIMLILTPALTRKGKSAAVFGFSLYSISAVYFFVQFATGVVFILIAPETFNTALLVQLCIAGLYGVMLVSNMIANERTADAEERRRHEIAYVKNAAARLRGLLGNAGNADVKRKVERVYDAVISSPVKTHPDLAQIENHILYSISVLEGEIAAGNYDSVNSLTDSLLSAVNERNMRLKQFNSL